MKIRVRPNDTDVGSINPGECFWYGGNLYIKTAHETIINNADVVNLESGNLTYLELDTQVKRANCMVISADDNIQKGKWDI